MLDNPARGHLSERAQHEVVADALAAVRLYRGHFASAQPSPDRVREIVEMLQALGKQHDMGKHGSILTTAADAISKTYLNEPAGETI